MKINADISIVGCGPVGATLANLLADYGHSVAIFEKETEIYRAPRAIHIDDEVIRIFQNVGILEELKSSIVPFDAMQFIGVNGDVLMETRMPSNYKPYGFSPANWFLQPTLEAKLRDCFQQKKQVKWFEGYDVYEVDNAKEAAHLKAKNSAAEKTVEVTSKYIIGCDGGKSSVREWMQTEFENLNFDERWMVVDTFLKAEKDTNLLPAVHQQICDPYRPTTYVPGVGNHRRFEFMLRANETKESINQAESIKKLITPFIDPDKLEIARSAVYTFHGLIADKWKKGRLMLAGDSAHLMPPFAGQGMCSGIRDAHNLAFKLHLALSEKASEQILNTYQMERKPHVITISKGAIKIGRMVQTQSKLTAIWRNIQFFFGRNSKFIQEKLRDDTIKKLPYKKGFLGKKHKLSGHLTIQPLIEIGEKPALLLDELLGNQFALISTKAIQPEQVNEFKNKINGQVLLIGKDFTSPVYEDWMRANKMEFIIIRPDRYIFDAGKMNDLEKVLNTLFERMNNTR